MSMQSFRGAGGMGAISVRVDDERLDRDEEIDAQMLTAPFAALRELVIELGRRVEHAVARGLRLKVAKLRQNDDTSAVETYAGSPRNAGPATRLAKRPASSAAKPSSTASRFGIAVHSKLPSRCIPIDLPAAPVESRQPEPTQPSRPLSSVKSRKLSIACHAGRGRSVRRTPSDSRLPRFTMP